MSNRVLIDQTTNTVNTDQCPEIHNSVVVNNEIPSNIDVIENVTNIITVTVPGPQGPQGPNGAEANISGSSNYIPIFSGSDALVTSSIYQSGSFTAIGATSSLHPNAPETLLVNSLTDSYNLISGHANIDDYVQLNIKNFSGGPSASSDIVATADIGDEESNYINMGINGSNYTAGNAIGGALDAYLYNTGENLYIGNTAQSKQIVFFNGGFDVNAHAALFIHDQGTITINTDQYNQTYPPSLGIQAPNSTTNTLIEAVGNTNQFLQLALSNENSGSFASSDIVAYNNIDPTNQAFGFIDMGINSTNFDDPTNYPGWIGGHSYVFSDAPGMIIGSTSGSSQVNIFAGGVNPITNSKLVIRANNIHSLTGSLEVTGSITSSLFGTASWALNAITASYVPASGVVGLNLSQISSGSVSASVNIGSSAFTITSGSNNLLYIGSNGNVGIGTITPTAKLQVSGSTILSGNTTITGSLVVTENITAQTLVVQTITSSIVYSSGSNIFGNNLSNTHQFTGSVSITGSLQLTGDTVLRGSGDTSATTTFISQNSANAVNGTIYNDGTWFFGGGNTRLAATAGEFNFNTAAGNISRIGHWGMFFRPIQAGSVSLELGTDIKMLNTNVLIGTTADSGQRLQVSGSSKFAGDMVITGSGNTSATNALNIRNSSGTSLLSVRNDASVILPNFSNITSGNNSIGFETFRTIFSTTFNTLTGQFAFNFDSGGGSSTLTSGATGRLALTSLFSPTSGTATYTTFYINSNVNQTGGANGITRGLHLVTGITAAADFRAIEWNNNAATAPSQSWGLYGSGSAPNYINGSLSIGTLTTGNALTVSGSSVMSGSLTVTQGITSSLFGTASWAQNALTASFVSTASLASNFFVQGGNSFGTTALLGTNDSQSLAFETSGSVRMFISSSGNVGIGTSTPTVALQVASDAIISDIRVGTGPGTGNVYIGQSVGGISTTNAQSMDDNVFIGRSAGSTFSGNSNGNVAIGVSSLRGGSNVEYNTAVGFLSLQNYTGQYTTALGYNAGGNLTSGGFNTIIGYNTGLGITTGASNTIIGAQITGLASNLANTIAISDGAGTIRIYSPSTGNVLIQNGGTFSDSGERLQVSGSTRLSGNTVITGSLIVTQGITGSLFGTSSWANNAVSASQATTASSADNFTVRGTLTAQTIVVQTITSSTDFVSGSTIFGNNQNNTHQFTGSVSITGSLTLPYLSTGSILFAGATDNIAEDNTNFFWDNTNKRLGVGTNTPSYRLDVTGNARINSGGTSTNGLLQFFGVTGGYYHDIQGGDYATHLDVTRIRLGNSGTHWQGVMSFWTKDVNTTTITERMRINQLGSIGIGTTSPTALLHISGSTGGLFGIDSNTIANILYVSSSGNIGIGTNAPTDILDIRKNQVTTTVATTTSVLLSNTNASGIAAYAFTSDGTTRQGGLQYNNTTGQRNLFSCTYTSIPYYFGTNSVIRLMITGDTGNIIIQNGGTFIDSGERLQVSGSTKLSGNTVITGSLTVATGSGVELFVTNTGVTIGNAITDTHTVTGSLNISGSVTATNFTGSLFGTASWAQNAVTASYATTAQTLLGSVVSASYAATASYATSFYVSGTLNVGKTNIEFQENTNVTSGTWRVVSSEPTASYKAAFFDYVMFSGSIARAGTVYSVWSASYAEYYENYTGDVGGSTAGVSLQAAISGSNIQLQATASNNGWTIRSLVRML